MSQVQNMRPNRAWKDYEPDLEARVKRQILHDRQIAKFLERQQELRAAGLVDKPVERVENGPGPTATELNGDSEANA